MANYTTSQGDTWDIISLINYGSELYADTLVAANRGYKSVGIFGAGVVLSIPALESKKASANLPPWRR